MICFTKNPNLRVGWGGVGWVWGVRVGAGVS